MLKAIRVYTSAGKAVSQSGVRSRTPCLYTLALPLT